MAINVLRKGNNQREIIALDRNRVGENDWNINRVFINYFNNTGNPGGLCKYLVYWWLNQEEILYSFLTPNEQVDLFGEDTDIEVRNAISAK